MSVADHTQPAGLPHSVTSPLLAANLAEDTEIDAHVAALHGGELDLTLAPLISAWGRRPAHRSPALG